MLNQLMRASDNRGIVQFGCRLNGSTSITNRSSSQEQIQNDPRRPGDCPAPYQPASLDGLPTPEPCPLSNCRNR